MPRVLRPRLRVVPNMKAFVIGATGVLHHPVVPDIEGLNTFAGDAFHSARWDHSVDLERKRVGVIGTGSTAAQIIGETGGNIDNIKMIKHAPDYTEMLIDLEVWDLKHLNDVISGLRSKSVVNSVGRVHG